MNKINTIDAAKPAKLAYSPPQAIEVGDAAELVQGGGGASGMDYLYYYWFDGNGQ
jgi:hypothetical protein